MMKGGLFGRRRIRQATRRPNGWRPSVEALESRELLSGDGFLTAAPAYLVPVAAGVTTTPLLTTGDVINRTGVPAQQYRMVGIPDGLGAFKDAAGSYCQMLWMTACSGGVGLLHPIDKAYPGDHLR